MSDESNQMPEDVRPQCATCGELIQRGEVSGMWVHVNPRDAQAHVVTPAGGADD
jgi:hypothetical protein